MTKEDLPAGVIPFGEVPGGDQICLGLKSRKVLRWKHDVEPDERTTGVANNITDFSQTLKPDPDDEPRSDLGIIEEDSWLDL